MIMTEWSRPSQSKAERKQNPMGGFRGTSGAAGLVFLLFERIKNGDMTCTLLALDVVE